MKHSQLKEETVFDIIKRYMLQNQYPPTTREICEISGLQSTSSVNFYLNRLKDKGLIDFIDGKPRTITIPGIVYRDENVLETRGAP